MKELRQEGKIGQIPDYSPIMKPEFPKMKAMHGALPTTHPSHRLNGMRSTVASGSPLLGRVRSLVAYSLQNKSTERKRKKREKSPSICKEHLKTENLNHLCSAAQIFDTLGRSAG